jgi:hypothetical protein
MNNILKDMTIDDANYNPADPGFQAWCVEMFQSLADGGLWGVPRSGQVCQRKGDKLVLWREMPWSPKLGCTEEQLWAYQREEYETIRAHFAGAGIVVEREETI